jgi:hypothetical protein
MQTQKYVEEFQRLAHRLSGDTQSALLFHFIQGLRPSLRVKVHERSHSTLQEAILHVCRMDTTWSAHNSGTGAAAANLGAGKSGNADSDMMDISAIKSLGPLSEEDKAACLAALQSEGLMYHDTSPISSTLSPPGAESNLGALAHLQQQISQLTQQLNSVNLSNRGLSKQKKKGQDKEGSSAGSGLGEIPLKLRKLRETYGYCIKCGSTKYSQGENGHNTRTCKNPPDKTTTPLEYRQGKPPSFQ